jgi:tRNA1(Val) A37 N6-methylase TrmN6
MKIIQMLLGTKYFKALVTEIIENAERKLKQMLIEKINNKIRKMELENELHNRNISTEKSNRKSPCLRLVTN